MKIMYANLPIDSELFMSALVGIIDDEKEYECNVIMDKHKHKPRDSKSEQPYILSGKLFCGFCGSLMTAETGTSHTGKLHHYYKCFGRKRNKHSCKKANYRQQDLEDLVFGTTVKYVLHPDVIQTVAEQVVSKFNSEIIKAATLENLENELKAKEKAINALLAAIEQGIVTKSAKDRLISLETQKEELESKISLEKARQIKPLEVDKVKAFLTYFARKKYENGQEKNEFFNSFINRVILYDDKILIFYNTDDNHPTVIKRKGTEELISHLNDITSNGKTATNDCPNTTGNSIPIVQKENSLEPQRFKRVSLGGETGICSCLLQSNTCEIFLCFAKAFGQPLKTTHRVVFLTLSFKSLLLSVEKQKRTSEFACPFCLAARLQVS